LWCACWERHGLHGLGELHLSLIREAWEHLSEPRVRVRVSVAVRARVGVRVGVRARVRESFGVRVRTSLPFHE